MKQADPKNNKAAYELDCLKALERKILWLASWMIHNANHLRDAEDGLKVGGHQASCASVSTVMTALYLDVLRADDRVAVKPHASPIFHAIQYLLGNQTREKLENFRALGGAQSYPSRTKDTDSVDLSTGSVGLGVGATLFASMIQDYVQFHKFKGVRPPGRMIAVMGDAELDEGNVFEALLEGWKHDVRNLWWIIDYNRQSLDRVVSDQLFQKIKDFFQAVGWQVVIVKYGKRQQAAFKRPGGEALRRWIDECSNELYSALTFKGATAWREHLSRDLGDEPGFAALLDDHNDEDLQALMTNLAGHDMEAVREAMHGVSDDRPHCFIVYTVKGFGLPFAGHKDNHAGLMNLEQMADFKSAMRITDGDEWEPFAGLDLNEADLRGFLDDIPFNQMPERNHAADKIALPAALPFRAAATMSTQESFGRILNELGKEESDLAAHIVTTSPDVTVSTNLGGWVNQRGIFNRADREDVFRSEKVVSMQKWAMSRKGQHVELGIAENNLFLMLAAMGLSGPLFGARLLPVGTVYDPFVSRGLDALNYACYMDARFMLAGTPSGITLAPEGGAHQSVSTPLIAMAQPGLTMFEPAYGDEVAEIMLWGFNHMQADDGGAVYMRLSTRPIDQPERTIDDNLRADIVAGAYWQIAPAADAEVVLVYSGAVAPDVLAAQQEMAEDLPGIGVLAVTSADRLHAGWLAARQARADGDLSATCHIERMLAGVGRNAALVSVVDGHPAALSWLGSVAGHRPYPLGVTKFGESGNIGALYAKHKIDKDAIVEMAALACVEAKRGRA